MYHIEWIRGDLDMGVETVILHNVNTNQEAFVREFGENVIDELG